MKALAILLVLTITSGCANNLIDPLCLPSRPTLQPITVVEQAEVPPGTLAKVADNDLLLKSWVVQVERITEAHNEQFKSSCP